uniref:Uncharacterized protein n=1 Tax=Romanomermis culicivorax TaxID=13658 RepID=A0A915L6I5_ROMCU
MKLESEGYPAKAQTTEQKCEYEMEVYNHENVSLDPSKISKNPGKRALAKGMLNFFWGKGEYSVVTVMKFCLDAQVFYITGHPDNVKRIS